MSARALPWSRGQNAIAVRDASSYDSKSRLSQVLRVGLENLNHERNVASIGTHLSVEDKRAYDKVETITEKELIRRVTATILKLKPMRDQAGRINAFRNKLRHTILENNFYGPKDLSAEDVRSIEEQLVRSLSKDDTEISVLSENDLVVISKSRHWAQNWAWCENIIEGILKDLQSEEQVRRLANAASLYLEYLAKAPASADYDSVIPDLTNDVASKFVYDCVMKDYDKLMNLSKRQPLLVYNLKQEDEAIVEIIEPVYAVKGVRTYTAYNTYEKEADGNLGFLPKAVRLLEENDVSNMNSVTLDYVTENYKYIPDKVKNLFRK